MQWKSKRLTGAVNVNQITEGVIWKTLLAFFFPIMLGTFFQQMYNTADAIIVGKFVGKEALAAVGGSTGTLINLIVGFFVGISSGATVILSQFYGARNNEKAQQTVHTAMAMALGGGAVITVFGFLAGPTMLRIVGTPADVLPHSIAYIRIYFLGMIPSLIYNIGSGLLRAVGDSRHPLYFLIVACLVNIVLDVLLVAGFDMGVSGAALATIISQMVSAVLVIYTLRHSNNACRLDIRKIRFHAGLLGNILRIGLPAGLQSAMYSISNVVIQSSINGFGTDVAAAYTAFSKVEGLYWMLINAFGISITTFVGQNFGARHYDRVKKSVRICLGITAVTTVIVSSVMLLGGETLYHLFTDDAAVVDYGLQILRQLAPVYITYICIEVFSGALRGAGDTLLPTLFTLLGVCGLRVVWVLCVVPTHRTLHTLLLIYPISWVFASILFIVYYLRGGWLKRAMRKLKV